MASTRPGFTPYPTGDAWTCSSLHREASKGSPVAKQRKIAEPFPDLFVEALAYHEAGHVLMAVLFNAPIKYVAIADRCAEPGYNGRTEFAEFAWSDKRD